MKVLSSRDLQQGKRAEYNKMGSSITQPAQFIPKAEKDDEWAAWNMDFLEWQGLRQIRKNARKLMKNYKLAKGIIDKTDYLVEPDNEYREIVDTLTKEDQSAFELKYYPIIPNVINVLCAEFAKRSTSVSYRAVDEQSYNEFIEQKKSAVEQVLTAEAKMKVMQAMIQQGLNPDDPKVQQQMQQESSPDKLKSLPEIQRFFTKSYRGAVEEWASHQHKVDCERFRMDELEERAFRDMLIGDREFWHYKMNEDDYELELWNPVLVFYHKSADARYISQSNWVGKIDMLTAADVVDKYGWAMTPEQVESIEAIYPIRAAAYPLQGYQNDGSYYDATKSHDWNTSMPSLAYRQFTSMYDNFAYNGGDIVNWILGEGEDYQELGDAYLLRVTTAYWKSQVKLGHLTKISDNGAIDTDIITEDYKVTDKPVYNTSLYKNKTKDNLIFGEHIDWIWINEVWGGLKIGPNRPSFWGTKNPGGINPMYLGINQNKISRLKFQFKGDLTLYGCKLPVEGAIYSDRNTKSTSCVDLMKPFQIGYNIVNNQIADILVDELGTVILLDQNALPRHSMGEDWGKNNLAKAFVAMKDFQMLPLDTSLTNTENALSFSHFQTLNLEQTQRMLSRVQLANYFKQQAYEVIGVTPQRMGQQIGQTSTATGIEQAVTGSYAQTEMYFIQHCDYLMPRVHQMRTDLAQFYHSTKPSTRLQYITSKDERVNFEIFGTDLLSRELNVFATTTANYRSIMEKIENLAVTNNTSGASIYDLGSIMQSTSLSEMETTLKQIDAKTQQARQEQMQHEQQLKEMDIQAREHEEQLKMDWNAQQKELDRRKEILIAQIRSAGNGAGADINQNKESDFQDYMEGLQKQEAYKQEMDLKKEKNINQVAQSEQKNDLAREKLQADKEMKNIDLRIAQDGLNRSKIVHKADKKKK